MTDETMITAWEALHSQTLTEEERAILFGTRPYPYSIHDGQRAYLLREALAPLECPACKGVTSKRAAHVGGAFDWNRGPDEDRYVCPHCARRLVWCLGFFAGQQWFTLAEPIPGGEG